jgi:hypothetical protein
MSDQANQLLKQWQQANAPRRADAIEYLNGMRTGVPMLAAKLLRELAYASPGPCRSGIGAAIEAALAGRQVRRNRWSQKHWIRFEPSNHSEDTLVTEQGIPWQPLQGDCLATDWEVLPKGSE